VQICKDLLYGIEVDWWSVGSVMQDMMVDYWSEVFYNPKYSKNLTPDALSILEGVSINGGTTNTLQFP
jgi:hypothetical protein